MNLAEMLNLRAPARARRVTNRELLVVRYRSDAGAIRALLPEPLQPDGSGTVALEFLATPVPGAGAETEVRVTIPAWSRGTPVDFVLRTWIDEDDDAQDADESLRTGHSRLVIVHDTLTGMLESAGRAVAVASMGYRRQHFVCGAERLRDCPADEVVQRLSRTQVRLQRVTDGAGRVLAAQLVGCRAQNVRVKGAWAGPAQLYLPSLAASPLPVRELLGGLHCVADLTLPAPRVLHDDPVARERSADVVPACAGAFA
jgi:acetoacetate decarboxylase